VKRLVYLLVILTLASSLQGAVIVNEVLVNEPGSNTSLEWIELYNTGNEAHLSFYELRITSGTTVQAYSPQGTIPSGQFMILSPDTAAFREFWGNAPFDEGQVVQLPISLPNQLGIVSLQSLGSGGASTLTF
jgi:hypothetical protein